MDDPALWIALLASLFASYWGACNIALKTFSRSRLAEMLSSAGREHHYAWFIANTRALVLVTGLVRVCMTLIILMAVLHLIEGQWEKALITDAVALGITAGLVAVFGVAIPVSWAAYHRERLLVSSQAMLRIVLILLTPVVKILGPIDPIVRRVSGANENGQDESDVTDEVMSVVEDHGEGAVGEEQRDLIEAVFQFPTTTAGEIMTPRTDAKGISVDANLEEVKRKIIDEGFSRYPVYEENLDNIVGVLYAKDLIPLIGQDDVTTLDLRTVVREPMLIPESKPLPELLAEFKERKIHIAIVLDEYGGTAGLLTVEDIVEELVGDIYDEYERISESESIKPVSEYAAEVDARVYIDDINDELDIELPEDADFDTVGGFVFSTLGHIPEVGERFDWEDLRVTVLEVDRTKVNRVLLETINLTGGSDDDAGPGRRLIIRRSLSTQAPIEQDDTRPGTGDRSSRDRTAAVRVRPGG